MLEIMWGVHPGLKMAWTQDLSSRVNHSNHSAISIYRSEAPNHSFMVYSRECGFNPRHFCIESAYTLENLSIVLSDLECCLYEWWIAPIKQFLHISLWCIVFHLHCYGSVISHWSTKLFPLFPCFHPLAIIRVNSLWKSIYLPWVPLDL